MKPEVSVLMPVYNGEKFIKESVESILMQTLKNFELIIIDDGSTDMTSEIIETFDDRRIRLIKNQANTGLGNVRNQCLSEARGEYVAWNDADDISLPDRLTKQTNFLNTNPEIGMIGAWVKVIDEHSLPTGVSWKDNIKTEEMPASLLFHNRFAQSSVMIRKSILSENPYQQEFAPAEDYKLWVDITIKSKTLNYPKILLIYREHRDGQSKIKLQTKETAVKKIITGQLGKIGIKPTDEELTLHRTNYRYTGDGLMEFLSNREKWLSSLIEANNAKKIYPPKIFKKILAKQWLTSCSSNTSIGLEAWKKFRQSPLASNLNYKGNRIMLVKFIIKCLLSPKTL